MCNFNIFILRVKKVTDNIGGVQQFATRLLENGSESEIMALKKLIFTQMLQLFSQIPHVDVETKFSYTPDINGFENHCRVSLELSIVIYDNLIILGRYLFLHFLFFIIEIFWSN